MKTKNKILLIITILFFILYFLTSCNDDEETTPDFPEQNTGTPCDGIGTLDYGGQTYHTIRIADQCWMSENLNIGEPLLSNDTLKDNGTIEKYCYQNNEDNCQKYGGLYPWGELMNYTDSVAQGICPDGWHIPTDQDYNILEAELASLYSINDTIWNTKGWRGYNAGGKLKMSGLEEWYNPNTGAENSIGFTAVPAGIHYQESKTFDKIKCANYLWSSTKAGETSAWFRLLSYGHMDVKRSNMHIENAFSVRCIKDN